MNEPAVSLSCVASRGTRSLRIVLVGFVAIMGGVLFPSLAAQPGQDLTALKARSQALDEELGREMRRLQVYLGYVDQTLGMQMAQGFGASEAKDRLVKTAASLYQSSYSDADLRARMTEHERGGEAFFRFIENQIAAASRWPAGRSAQDYRALAQSELQAIRTQFSALRSNPAALIPTLSRAARTLGWTRGEAAVSGDRDPFAQSAERVISALSEEHGRHVVRLGRGEAVAGPTAVVAKGTTNPSTRLTDPRSIEIKTRDASTLPVPPPLPPGERESVGAPTADVSGLLAEAESAFGQANLVEARRLFEKAIQAKSVSAEAWMGLGRCQNSTGELDAAMASYVAARQLAADTPNLNAWIAEICIARGDGPAARRWITEELKLQPNSAWAWSWLGTIEQEAGNPGAAQRTFARAVQLDARVAEYRFQSANWMGRNNQPRRALMDSLAVIAMAPNHAGAYYAVGSCYAQLGQAEPAVSFYERFLQFDATSEWAQKARAEINRLKPGR